MVGQALQADSERIEKNAEDARALRLEIGQ